MRGEGEGRRKISLVGADGRWDVGALLLIQRAVNDRAVLQGHLYDWSKRKRCVREHPGYEHLKPVEQLHLSETTTPEDCTFPVLGST